LRTPTAFAVSDVSLGSIPDMQADEVELLTCGTEVVVALGNKGEPLGTVEWAVLAESAVPRAHIGDLDRNLHHTSQEGTSDFSNWRSLNNPLRGTHIISCRQSALLKPIRQYLTMGVHDSMMGRQSPGL
jgi:hypothetical protein